jgi:two-component system sensor histidine kinase YesM
MARAGKKKKAFRESGQSIQRIILTSFSIATILIMLVLTTTLYGRFERRLRTKTMDDMSLLMDQAAEKIEVYLRTMRKSSDALYYDVLKQADPSSSEIDDALNLMFTANNEDLVSIALFDSSGELIAAAPSAVVKPGVDVTSQEWFTAAVNEVENFHYTAPHVQNLFLDQTYRYNWVVSQSFSVTLTRDGQPEQAVLLVDMNYAAFERLLNEVNLGSQGSYVYLMDAGSSLIYHPYLNQIQNGRDKENNIAVLQYPDGVSEEEFNGEKRMVIVNTIAYTGWRLVSVTPFSSITLLLESTRYAVLMIFCGALIAILLVNRYIARRISRPLAELDEEISGLGSDGRAELVVAREGSAEVQHLARTLKAYQESNQRLVADVVAEQEEKRRAELDALQSQINPHFLYNTLDSIVWMIEKGDANKEAVFMITQLASFFRISLSKGHTIIPIADEIRHARNYMNIQQVRFKNAFTVSFEVDPAIENDCTVKLIVQPILENAIDYGVKNLDEDGRIEVRGWREGGDDYISVTDNGYGMTPQEAANVLKDTEHKPSHGSGVGLINVHRRIQLRFGQAYGLKIESELDEGTRVIIHLPSIPYSSETVRKLEGSGEARHG